MGARLFDYCLLLADFLRIPIHPDNVVFEKGDLVVDPPYFQPQPLLRIDEDARFIFQDVGLCEVLLVLEVE